MGRFVLVTARKDLRRRLADPTAMVTWVVVPALLGLLMSLLGGGDGGSPTAHVLLDDRDETMISGLLPGAASQGPIADLVRFEPVGSEDGRRRIEEGEASALLVIPEGFSDAVLGEGKAELLLVTNPAQRILPGIVEGLLEVLVDAVFYLQQVFEEPLDAILDSTNGEQGPSNAEISEISIMINDRIQGASDLLFPPALSLTTGPLEGDEVVDGPETEVESPGGLDIARLFLPGLIFMSLLFVAQGTSDDFWDEREQGTLLRVLVAPRSLYGYVAGKVLAGTALMAVISVAALGVGVVLFDLSIARAPAAVVWCALAGASLLSLFMLLSLLATTHRGAGLVSTIVLFPLLMIGGSFFPFEAMPGWMAAIGRWTPNGLAVVRLRELLRGEVDMVALAMSAMAITAMMAVCFALIVRRVGGRFGSG